jgi:Domain of unknown function (DUF4288)
MIETDSLADEARRTHWYVAELVIRFDISGDSDWLFHVNATLISASSADDALRKAYLIGVRDNTEFTNTDGNLVQSQFIGLRELFEVNGVLQDGTELFYEELNRPRDFGAELLIKPERELAAFKGKLTTEKKR